MGGRAFASQRTRNEDLVEYADRRGPTVYIGPPGFQPELIANVAIAIAACHSANFNARLPPVGDDAERPADELAFPTADSVADFVRRAFIGSGRSRGGGGEAPAIEGGGPQEPSEGEGHQMQMVRGLVDYLDFWGNPDDHFETDEDGVGRVHFLDGANRVTFGHDREHPVANIEEGALQLIAALLAGFPRDGNDAYFEQWQSAAGTLDGALTELGIWRSWFFGGGHLNRANACLLGSINALLSHGKLRSEDATRAARQLIAWPRYAGAPSTTIDDYLEYNLHYWHPFHNGGLVADSQPPTERYEALFTWPVPRYAQDTSGPNTVGQLLATFVCSPAEFVGKPPALLDIVGFAAAFLGSRTEERTDSGWRENAAANWLARSMPRYMFGKDAEIAILTPLSALRTQAVGVGA